MLGVKNEENGLPQPPARLFPGRSSQSSLKVRRVSYHRGVGRVSWTRKAAFGWVYHEANGEMGLGVQEAYWGREQEKIRRDFRS